MTEITTNSGGLVLSVRGEKNIFKTGETFTRFEICKAVAEITGARSANHVNTRRVIREMEDIDGLICQIITHYEVTVQTNLGPRIAIIKPHGDFL